MEPVPVFRAPKKRKLIQSPNRRNNDELVSTREQEKGALDESANLDVVDNIATVIRARKSNRSAKSGITFSNTVRPVDNTDESKALVHADTSNDKLQDMSNRFVGSTGQVVDVDNHMYVSPILSLLHQ